MEKYFICEICKCETPIECEGSEQNTCADCMPPDFDFDMHSKRKGCEIGKYSTNTETPPKMAQNEPKSPMIKFWLNGCDIAFIAEAPADITLKDLLKQCDKIEPHWCACGIKSFVDEDKDWLKTEIFIDYNSIRKASDDVSCNIKGETNEDIH